MVQRHFDKILNEYTKHTNLLFPYSKYIGVNKFPEQNEELLNSNVLIKCRDMYIVDDPEKELTGPDKYEDYYIYEDTYKVVRADKVEPYIMICISLDYKRILVTDTRKYNDFIAQYPVQLDEFIGMELEDQYMDGLDRIRGIALRVDNGEPCFTVIIEFINNSYRFVLGDECLSVMKNYDENKSPKTVDEIVEIRKEVLKNIIEE